MIFPGGAESPGWKGVNEGVVENSNDERVPIALELPHRLPHAARRRPQIGAHRCERRMYLPDEGFLITL